jgi:hypothetical protein
VPCSLGPLRPDVHGRGDVRSAGPGDQLRSAHGGPGVGAGNNFELAIAVSISVWSVISKQGLAGVIGSLIEVPVLVAVVYASLGLRQRLFPPLRPVVGNPGP